MSVRYAPYDSDAANAIYNLIFCDALEDFQSLAPHFPAIFAASFDEGAVRTIAEDNTAEGRVRCLAYRRLRSEGAATPRGEVLGVVVEVALERGLDTLAAYADGRVRYINQTGAMSIIEDTNSPLREKALALVSAAAPLVARIGPWTEERRPPPTGANARLSFLVSDGLYFGEGPMDALSGDPLGGAVVKAAVDLLMTTVDLAAPGDAPSRPS